MESSTLSQLLKLPAGDRAELAMALWESLSDAARDGDLALTEEQGAESIVDGPNTWQTRVPPWLGLKCGEGSWAAGNVRCCFSTPSRTRSA